MSGFPNQRILRTQTRTSQNRRSPTASKLKTKKEKLDPKTTSFNQEKVLQQV